MECGHIRHIRGEQKETCHCCVDPHPKQLRRRELTEAVGSDVKGIGATEVAAAEGASIDGASKLYHKITCFWKQGKNKDTTVTSHSFCKESD
eukprot:2370241-Amphidinium_carterae.1